MAERVECDACKRHDAPCMNVRCSCACTPPHGRECSGQPCRCYGENTVKVLTGTALGAMDWRPAA